MACPRGSLVAAATGAFPAVHWVGGASMARPLAKVAATTGAFPAVHQVGGESMVPPLAKVTAAQN